MSQSRLAWLEEQLERDDLTELQWDSYNSEANLIQTEINERKARLKAIKEQERIERLKSGDMVVYLSLYIFFFNF